MRLLTNLCTTLTFTAWPASTTPTPSKTKSSLASIHPHTHQSLILHLHSYPSPTPLSTILTKVDLLISALHPSLNPISNPLITSEHGVHDHRTGGGITRPLTVQPDLAIFASNHALPVTSFVTTTAPPFPHDTCIRSPAALAACYNDIFSDERFADPARTDVNEIRGVMCAVGHAVAVALCTTTGCAGITDGRVTVLLRVTPACEGRVSVAVTCAFEGDPAVALVGLVGWTLRCGDVKKGVRECVLRVGNAKTKFWFDGVGRVRFGRWMGGFVERLLKGCVSVAGVGGSGVVLESRWKGRAVAVKYWNDGRVEGLEELWDEIGVYRMLVQRFPHVVGQVVPELVYCRMEGGEAVLVTEYVGKGLRREGGRLFVGDDGKAWQVLEERDERLVVQAAKYSLFKLHECGVAHGDVQLSNLRVELVGDHSWKAWWIDLAHAEDVFEDSCCVHVDLLQFHNHIVDGFQ